MQSHCPHCDKLVDVPERQIDVMCPNCHRFFLWTPGMDDETQESEEAQVVVNKEAEHIQHIRSAFNPTETQSNTDETSQNDSENLENSDSDGEDRKPNSVGLYRNNTLKYVPKAEQTHQKRQRVKKTGKNMYPYELPGQVVEADRRMPVYSSMMSDAFTILKCNIGVMIVSVFFYTVFLTALVFSCGTLYWVISETAEAFSKENPVTFKLLVFSSLLLLSTFGFTWIMNGQRLYVIDLIRYGKTNVSYLFSGFSGFFRNLFVLWLHLAPLSIPACVGYCFYLWKYYNGDIQQIEENLGIFYFVYQQTPVPVAIAASILGIGVFLIIVLNWGLAFWLILDKNLSLFESLEVSHKITREKKATFLGILCSSNGIVVLLSVFTGITFVLFPIALLFIGMYYMKTAIQEMVIPGKTDLGARINLYGDDGKMSNHYNEEEDIL